MAQMSRSLGKLKVERSVVMQCVEECDINIRVLKTGQNE